MANNNIVVFEVVFSLVLHEQICDDAGWIVVFVLLVVVVVAFVMTIQLFCLHRLFIFEGFGELL